MAMLQPQNFESYHERGQTEVLAASRQAEDLMSRVKAQQQRDPYARARMDDLRRTPQGAASPFLGEAGALWHSGRLYVPFPLREEVLRLCHDHPAAGHGGVFKTIHAVLRDYWWPKLAADVKTYVASCHTCRRAKPVPGRPAGLLQPLPTPPHPWHTVSMDFITDLPPVRGYTSILVVVDLFTKMAHFIPCQGLPSAQETAQLFLDNVFRHRGMINHLVSDRGPQFTSKFWRALFQALGVQSHLSSAHHPASNGEAEKLNRYLQQYLRCYSTYQQDNWLDLIPMAEFAYNNSVHASTKMSPFQAQSGVNPRVLPCSSRQGLVTAAADFLGERQAAQQMLKEQLERAKAQYKRNADRRRQEGPAIEVGLAVYKIFTHE